MVLTQGSSAQAMRLPAAGRAPGAVGRHDDDHFIGFAFGAGDGAEALFTHQQRGVEGVGVDEVDLALGDGGPLGAEAVVELEVDGTRRAAARC
jgi:hypothetical protein